MPLMLVLVSFLLAVVLFWFKRRHIDQLSHVYSRGSRQPAQPSPAEATTAADRQGAVSPPVTIDAIPYPEQIRPGTTIVPPSRNQQTPS